MVTRKRHRQHANNHKMRTIHFRDLYHPAPYRWEWINKYFRLACLLIILPYTVISKRDVVQQPYCWSEYEDVASRTYVAPVVVKAWCTVVYSRSLHTQFNATFHISKILKGSLQVGKYLENNPRIQLSFGVAGIWSQFPVTATEILQEGLLRNQVCSIPRVDVQKEYLLFLQPHNGLEESGSVNELADDMPGESNHVPTMSAMSWSIYAAPELASEQALANVHKVLRRAKQPIIAKLRPINITEGAELVLHCRTRGFPHPKVLWYKDGEAIQHRQRKSYAIRNHRRIHRLRIKKSRTEYSGTYRCVAINVLGTAQAETTVHIMAASDPNHWIVNGIPCTERRFCLNDGICTFYPRLNARSCNCSESFTGARCELKAGETLELRERAAGAGAVEICAYITVFTNILCIIFLLILLCFAYQYLQRTKTPAPVDDSLETPRSSQRRQDVVTSSNASENQSITASSTVHPTDAERQTLLPQQYVITQNHTALRTGPPRVPFSQRTQHPDSPARNGSSDVVSTDPIIHGQRWIFPSNAPAFPACAATSTTITMLRSAVQEQRTQNRRYSAVEPITS